jgi:hypothetical protein
MQIREIVALLDSASADSAELKYTSKGNVYELRNLSDFREAVNFLHQVPVLRRYTEPLLESVLFKTDQEEFSVVGGWDLIAISRSLSALVEPLANALRATMPLEEDNMITVRLPDVIDLSSVVVELEELEKAISQLVVNPEINGQVRVHSWHPGSLWIDLALASKSAVMLVGGAVYIARLITQERAKARAFSEYLRTIGDSELVAKFEEQAELKQTRMVESEADHLEHHAFTNDSDRRDRIERIKHASRIFADLMDRGAQIRPVLTEGSNNESFFPDPDPTVKLEMKVKNLGNSETTPEA